MKVRGTPASGKTVLAQLLAAHISQQNPDVDSRVATKGSRDSQLSDLS